MQSRHFDGRVQDRRPLGQQVHGEGRDVGFAKAVRDDGDDPTADQLRTLEAATPLVHERMTLLTEAVDMLRFLFIADEDFSIDETDRAKNLDEAGLGVVRAAHEALADVTDWSTEPIEEALRGALIEGLGLKPRLAFGPVRVAVTGSRISPPLFESLELLGRDTTLARLSAATAS